ncbi:MAG TPA: hypothetical protein VJK48_04630 [Chlamydiales bacterium]|nr:hypothetical protein [Chlamydiales bacterium]
MKKKAKTAKPKKQTKKNQTVARDREQVTANSKAQWHAYRDLRAATDKAWTKLRADIKRKAPMETLIKDRNALNLLLGECNYMTREYISMEEQAKK